MIKPKSSLPISALFSVCLLSPFVFHTDQKVKIQEKNGVTIIKNPRKPVTDHGGPTSLTMTEDFCLGDDPDADFMLEDLRTIQVDKDGDIIALDWGANKILVFDKEGQFLRSFGKNGQGPKELQGPSRMYLRGGKDICIMDTRNNRIAYYSKEGECLKEIQMGKYRAFMTIPDSRGYIYANYYLVDTEVKRLLSKFDPEYNLVQTVAEYSRPLNAMSRISPIVERYVFTVLPDDQLAWAFTTEYSIHFINPSGKHVRTIVKDYDRTPISDEEKKLIIEELFGDDPRLSGEKFNFPRHYHPMFYFICDDRSRIYVRTYFRNNENEFKWDVFNERGLYILSFFHPAEEYLWVIQKDKAYAMIKENEEGLPLIKRYQLHWE